ncbi:hypothetical protein MUK72_17825 (plasmid) [Halococcus dombrowskii]|uniref:DUF8160 domain-containing protein n=1 Tax=Halococcus dombrowskii TaxID=179637 RepID=A0AAV3SF89_HALDO|nr:hypothetical protein [Halococcus dombrowskii]UOO97127.1 hypothetical protein MUK72_17825 [Halococcus dombrowskii]
MSEREADMSRLAAREGEKESNENDDSNESERERGQDSSQSPEGSEGPTGTAGAESVSERRVNVKDRESNLFMHLPESLANDVDLACQSVNLTYQSESGEKLGKNRYLYPIVLMVGADNAVDLSHEEIQDLVERVDGVEDG